MLKPGEILIAVLISIPAAGAQRSVELQSAPSPPGAPLPAELGNETGNSISSVSEASSLPNDQISQQPAPDTHLLSGVEMFGLGSLHALRHGFDPAVHFSESAVNGAVAGRYVSVSELGGTLNTVQAWRHYRLIVAYNGAETTYQPSAYGLHYLPYHDASIAQAIALGRWTLYLRDDVLYSWQAGFTGLFTGGTLHAGNTALNDIQPTLASNGTIETGFARQLSNTATAEADYAFSRRTTVTVVGTYSLTDFLDHGYINSKAINGRVGYNYALSAKNNFAFTYDYGRVSFAGSSARTVTDLVQIAFGRKITGRLAFQIAAGPQLLHFGNFGSASTRQLSWSALSALTYQWGRTGYSLSYFRGVTPGSGVLLGSDAQTTTGSIRRDISKSWSASLNGGYAVNRAVVRIASLAGQFDNWFAAANVNHAIGAQVHVSLTYAFQQQTSAAGACPVASCGLPESFSQLGLSLQWHPLARGR